VDGIIEERVTITAPAGDLPGILAYPEEGRPIAGLLVAGPHPFLGGQLENNVVEALARAAAKHGRFSLRFAYRRSEGEDLAEQMNSFWATGHAPQDEELLHDLRAALEFARETGPVTGIAAYSFSCWLTSRLVAEDGFSGSVALVAPTVEHHEFDTMCRWPGPKLVVGSADDFATSAGSLAGEVGRWHPPVELEMFDGAEHFFRGQEG